jgi:uncharacterized protein YjbI with pentapeptide repeats
MASEEQLSILKQGVDVWNEWRAQNPYIDIDLGRADLKRADLGGADLAGANLTGALLIETDLPGANLRRTHLSEAYLKGAVLNYADLSYADLSHSNLSQANLSKAKLSGVYLREALLIEVNLIGADLRGADLMGADLRGADLRRTDLTEADLTRTFLNETNLDGALLIKSKFSYANIFATIFGYSDLSKTIGLEDIVHKGPSRVSTYTFVGSKGNIPKVFLEGCGLSDWEIEAVKLYDPELSNEEINDVQYKVYGLRASQALQISPLFISYSQTDGTFVDKLESKLNEKGIRFWRDIHDMKSGRMETQIDRAIYQNPTVLLILSKNSLNSDWVEHEVRTARALEKHIGHDVLCPVALDDSWKDSRWPKRIMEQIMEYNILDFSAWKDDSKFDSIFRKLVDGLEVFYKG